MPVAPIPPISGIALPEAARSAVGSRPGAFQEALTTAIQQVEGMRNQADASVQSFLSGEGEELHSTILATERAQLSFDLFLQMRNKVVNAYQEIMRMQV